MNICWLRRDLRLHDNHALSEATLNGETQIVFVFDTKILNRLKNKHDQRVSFIYNSLIEIEEELQKKGSSLLILYGDPAREIPAIVKKLKADALYFNRDYEPYAKKRDEAVVKALTVPTHSFKDTVFFEKEEIPALKVFGAYKKRWIEKFDVVSNFKVHSKNFTKFKNPESILSFNWYKKIGFHETPPTLPAGRKAGLKRLKNFLLKMDQYSKERDFPAKEGNSLLSVYLRFGNLSIREVIHETTDSTFLSELIWREFYQALLDAYPHVEKNSFKPQYDQIKFIGEEKHFKLWCEGKTGFPLIDAAMRCLNETGLMHNRLRMVVASFLCKTLLIDWRKGEAYFAEKLLDYDLAANNGGWQWCSSSGADSQPFFRIFNPENQRKKFDPDNEFIKKWVKEFGSEKYPGPIVSYSLNRLRCLKMYSVVKQDK